MPVLVDGDRVVTDSFKIAKYLEHAYPDGPSLFGGAAGEAGCLFVNAFSDTVMTSEAVCTLELALKILKIHSNHVTAARHLFRA